MNVSVSCRLSLPFLPEMNAGRRHHNLYMAGVWLTSIFSYINATFNFAVYYAMGSRYRQTFWTMLGRKSAKSKSINTSEIVTNVSTAL